MTTFDFEPKTEYFSACIEFLFQNLAQHQPFLRELEGLRRHYSRILTVYSLSQISILRLEQTPIDKQDERDCREAREYYDELATTVTEYGLNPEWAIEQIEHGVRHPKAIAIIHREAINGHPPKQYTITWNDWMFLPKKEIEKYVISQFRAQYAENERELEKLGFMKARKRGSLKDHVRWVFKRVCLKKSWNQIATEELFNMDTIRHAVEPIIKLLGLQPPKLRGGRPQK